MYSYRMGRGGADALQGVEKLLRRPSAALRGTSFLAYLIDMSRRCAPCALHLAVLATFFNTLLSVMSTDKIQPQEFAGA